MVTRSLVRITLGIVAASGVLVGAGVDASDDDSILFREHFESGLGERWVEQGIRGIRRKNTFSLAIEADGNQYLHVESSRSISGKGVRLKFSPHRCPHLSWRWRVSQTIASADITRKDGDDAAAKLYLIFDGPSRWNPFDRRFITYVWDNAAPVGGIFPNAWSPDRERMLVLESGNSKAGQWVTEHVNLEEDFLRAFSGEIPAEVEALAFLADTDNTSSKVSAGFDDLVIRCVQSAGEEPKR